jgi:hypothetical protein
MNPEKFRFGVQKTKDTYLDCRKNQMPPKGISSIIREIENLLKQN